jgi:hypothetical protein
VHQIQSTAQVGRNARGREEEAAVGQNALMRGLVHGVLLSMIVWAAAGYLALR